VKLLMKNRCRVFRRVRSTYYCEDLVTKKQESLKTRDKDKAFRLVAARKETMKRPASAGIGRVSIGRRGEAQGS
jgi:hypothetical protein